VFCEGWCSLARTRKLLRLLMRRKATVGADMLWQRRMMDEM